MIRRHGVIQLYAVKDDRLLASSNYDGVVRRNRVLSIWKRRYANKFNHCYIHIIPELTEEMEIKKNGQNFKRRRDNRLLRNLLSDSDFKKIKIYD